MLKSIIKNTALIVFTIILFACSYHVLVFAMYNYWAASVPPHERMDFYVLRGNISLFLFICLLITGIWMTIRLFKKIDLDERME